ncbi:MAG TPA: hypothetical protein VGC92_01245, partial [Phenylobacterium sp.]
ALFEGAPDRAERVRRLALGFFRLFDRLKAFGHVQLEQDMLPVLRPFVEEERRMREMLAQAAVGEGDPDRAATLAALLDHGVYYGLRVQGFSADEAALRIAEVANAWLAAPRPGDDPND